MQFRLLADKPDALEQVATWYYDTWCKDSGRYSLAEVRQKLHPASTNKHGAPLLVLAEVNQQVVGAAELKYHEMPQFPEYTHWLGGVFVCPKMRNKGIASQLVSEIIRLAKNANISHLYLQTEALSGGLYLQHGFTHLLQTDSKGVLVTVMVKAL